MNFIKKTLNSGIQNIVKEIKKNCLRIFNAVAVELIDTNINLVILNRKNIKNI